MKTWKKVLIFVVLGIIGLIGSKAIYEVVKDKMERAEMEGNISLAEKQLKQNNFKVVDSIIKVVDWRTYLAENGKQRIKNLKLGVKRNKFRIETDKVKQAIKEKNYTLADSMQSELIKECLKEDYTKKDRDYFMGTYTELVEATTLEMKPYLEKAKEGLANMYVKEDKFNKVVWYKDRTSPRYVNNNGFYVRFAEEKNDNITSLTSLVLTVQYFADDWLFHNKFKLLIDGKVYSFKPEKVERDSGNGGYIWEWSSQFIEDYVSKDYMSKRLVEVINSKETKIRFIGSKYNQEKIITKKQKNALKNVLLAYVSKGGYFKFINKIVK